MNTFVGKCGKHFFLSNAIHIQSKPLSASLFKPLGFNWLGKTTVGLEQVISARKPSTTRFFCKTSGVTYGWKDMLTNKGNSRYARLNRFQQFQGGNNSGNPFSKNSLRNVTLTGVALIAGTFVITPYLFQYVPPFTYFKYHPSHLVYAILGANCAIFALWQAPKYWRFLQRYMLLEKDHIYSKWSLIGSAFSHQEVWHLGMNMLALWSFGTSLATMLGPANFFSLYMNSAIAGSLFSLWYPHIARISMMAPSLGASGALFGVFGCFSYLVPNAKIMLFVFPIPGGAWLTFLGFMAWNAAGCVLRWGSFDYAAHLGGSVAGIIYGWYISEQIKREKARRMRRFSMF
ncbi:LAFE_0D05666g1_1 [Lachancea fermentati]|uniref:LAFE_0D05666g1_1 n=1 Tax=Lachancea fermentati TaxID=4955 RepID=A0A1G4MB52_LACFM|nr:LAFE_0D05666g1_1 [Lachancea fermentati]